MTGQDKQGKGGWWRSFRQDVHSGGGAGTGGDAYRSLVNHLHAREGEGGPLRILLLTGTGPGVGVSTLTHGLASFMSHTLGRKTLVVDAQFQRNNGDGGAVEDAGPGLADWLAGRVPLDGVLEVCGQGYQVMPPGDPLLLTQTLLDTRSVERPGLRELTDRFGVVLVDGAPLLTSPEVFALSSLVDGVILVAQAERTRREVVRACVEQLGFSGAPLVGGMLNRRRFHLPSWVYSRMS